MNIQASVGRHAPKGACISKACASLRLGARGADEADFLAHLFAAISNGGDITVAAKGRKLYRITFREEKAILGSEALL